MLCVLASVAAAEDPSPPDARPKLTLPLRRPNGRPQAQAVVPSDPTLNGQSSQAESAGTYREQQAGGELCWQPLGHLKTSEVGQVLERSVRRIDKYLRRHGLLEGLSDVNANADDTSEPEDRLAASAVSGQAPPAGPQWLRGLVPVEPQALAYDKPLCATLDGFTLHAATRAGGLDAAGREALLRYVLRPPIAQERRPWA